MVEQAMRRRPRVEPRGRDRIVVEANGFVAARRVFGDAHAGSLDGSLDPAVVELVRVLGVLVDLGSDVVGVGLVERLRGPGDGSERFRPVGVAKRSTATSPP
jgi:hypothetical protein